MGESEIRFGDKLFLYGQYLQNVEEYDEYEYNSVLGYMTTGGYLVSAIRSYEPAASLPGFVVDFGLPAQFTSQTPFSQMEMVDVTEDLSRSLPLPSGTKVWMPTTQLPEVYSPSR